MMAAGLVLSATPDAHADQQTPDPTEIISTPRYTEAQSFSNIPAVEEVSLHTNTIGVGSSVVEDFPTINEDPASAAEAYTQYERALQFYGPESGVTKQGFVAFIASLPEEIQSNPNITLELAKLNLILKSNPSEEKFSLTNYVMEVLLEARPLTKDEAFEALGVILEYPESESESAIELIKLFRNHQRETFDLVFHEDATPLEFMAGESSGQSFSDTDPNFQEYLVDKTLIGLDETASLITKHDSETIRTYTERVVRIHRYLTFRGLEATASSVEQAEQEIKEAQDEWGTYEIFSGHTLVVSDDTDEGIDFLVKNPTQIQRASDTFELLHGSETLESYQAVRQQALEKIASSSERMNVVFTMHGLPDVISVGTVLKDKQEISVNITPEDIVTALAKKYENQENVARALTEPDVIILANCYSGSFAMKVVEGLQSKKLPIPLIITNSEAGQESYGSKEQGIVFLDILLKNENPTISDIYGMDIWEVESNPVVLAPHQGDLTQPIQISALEGSSSSS